jgi:hypothetical protein
MNRWFARLGALAAAAMLFGMSPPGVSVGDPAPKIEAKSWFNGKAPSAKKLEGKVVLLEFWASW